MIRITRVDKPTAVVAPITSTSEDKTREDVRAGRKVKRTGYPPFTSHFKEIIRLSLITSWSEISRIKDPIKRYVKILVFIICIVGFIVQTRDFLDIYLAYPTMVKKVISYPSHFVQPAITVCNRNRMRKNLYCAEDGESCYHRDKDTYCAIYARNCPDNSNVTHFPGLYLYGVIDLASDWEMAYKYAHTSDLIRSCTKVIEGERTTCSKNYRIVPFVTVQGETNLCYTIDSQWEEPNAVDKTHTNTFIWELEFSLEPEEYVSHVEPAMVYAVVHDRRALLNPFTEGFSITGGWHHEAYVTMDEEVLLKKPFDTNCTDYLKLWKERGGIGPLSKMMCSEECKLEILKNRGKCIDRKEISYPHKKKLCSSTSTATVTSEIIKLCHETCGRACRDVLYNVEPYAVGVFPKGNCTTDWCRASEAKLTLLFNKFKVSKLEYKPKFESIQFYSYIGGYMGMWLGLSLVATFDFLQMACIALHYPIGKYMYLRQRKIKPSLKRPRHL